MMRQIFSTTSAICVILLSLLVLTSCSQQSSKVIENNAKSNIVLTDWQIQQNKDFADPKKSPLKPEKLANFKGLQFYPYDASYKVVAKLITTPDTPIFDMMTTSGISKKYRQYGIVQFRLENQDLQLNVYQSQDLKDSEEFRNYLFLPFYDATSGNGSYAGGRYISLTIPDRNSIIIDFNEAYNPYCAYSDGYSCPITPAVNNLQNIKILAGTKDYIK